MKNLKSTFTVSGLLLLSLFAEIPGASAQVIQSESFDGMTFPPTGWTGTGGGNPIWVRRTTGVNPVCTMHSGAAMARFSSFNVPPGSQEELITPVADFSQANGSVASISMWVYRDNSSTAGDSVSILINTSASLTGATRIGGVARSRFFFLPINEPANGWYNYTFNVPGSFNTNTNYFILSGTSHGGGNIFIDDVQWTEFPVACSAPVAGNAIAADTLICNGSGSTALSLNGSGLSGGGLTFQWQSGSSSTGPWSNFGANAATVSSGTVATGIWFRCYVTCSVGSVTDTSSAVFVNVNPNPSPVVTTNAISPVSFCSASAPLVFVASGALTYVWNPNIAINAIGDSAQASPVATTTYTVTGYDSTGCSGSASIVVNVSTTPSVNAVINNDTICSGQFVNLSASVVGGNLGIQFLWQPGSLTGANHSLAPTVSTTYTVAATQTQSGCTGYDSVSLVVNPTPVAGFTFAVNNLTYTFTNTSTGGTSYLWDFGDSVTDTSANPVHTYASTGIYTVTLTVTNGNCTNSFTQFIQVLSVNGLLPNGSQVQVFPNPVSASATVKFIYDESSIQLSVLNLMGQPVIEKVIYPVAGNVFSTEIDMTSLAEGVYALQINTATESSFIMLVKK